MIYRHKMMDSGWQSQSMKCKGPALERLIAFSSMSLRLGAAKGCVIRYTHIPTHATRDGASGLVLSAGEGFATPALISTACGPTCRSVVLLVPHECAAELAARLRASGDKWSCCRWCGQASLAAGPCLPRCRITLPSKRKYAPTLTVDPLCSTVKQTASTALGGSGTVRASRASSPDSAARISRHSMLRLRSTASGAFNTLHALRPKSRSLVRSGGDLQLASAPATSASTHGSTMPSGAKRRAACLIRGRVLCCIALSCHVTAAGRSNLTSGAAMLRCHLVLAMFLAAYGQAT